jgi:hypothetical protein
MSRMKFSRWLRSNSENYLLLDAQGRMAEKYGRPGPHPPHGAKEIFWRHLFVPVYRRLPWSARRFTIGLMPGSHRQHWTPPPTRHNPAV